MTRTIRDLAALHVQHRGMAPSEAALFVEHFAPRERNIDWEAAAPFLRRDVIERIDAGALAWCSARRMGNVLGRVSEFQLGKKRPLRTYSAEVLAEWIGLRGVAWFQEELDAIEERHSPRIYFPQMTEEPELPEPVYVVPEAPAPGQEYRLGAPTPRVPHDGKMLATGERE